MVILSSVDFLLISHVNNWTDAYLHAIFCSKSSSLGNFDRIGIPFQISDPLFRPGFHNR